MSVVTIAICTHNRADDVRICLEATSPQAGHLGAKILIVDSASEPEQAAKLMQSAGDHGALYIRSDEPGLSIARNRAHEAATNEWIAYLDDDAVPHHDWAERLVQALSAADARTAVIGGKIIPRWPDGMDADHITQRWMLLLSCVTDEGVGEVADGHNICGANFAIRRSALEAVGLFPLGLGRVASQLISGEEAYVVARLEELGFSSRYDSAFVVDHVIQPERMQLDWAAKRAYWEGFSRARLFKKLGRPSPPAMNPVKLAATLPALFGLKTFSSDPDFTIRYNMALGSLAEQFARV